MTSLTNQKRRLRRIEDMRRDLLAMERNPKEAARHRFDLGIATDEDVDALLPEVSPMIFFQLDEAFAADGRTRDQQLEAAPAERLALDAASLEVDRSTTHAALRELRHLAATGNYRTSSGWKRAAGWQQSYARVLLRVLVRIIVSNDARAAASGIEEGVESEP